MIQIFDIKRAKKNLNNKNFNNIDDYKDISFLSNEQVIKNYNSNINGISSKEVSKLFDKYGKNIVVKEDNKSWFYFFINAFKDEFIIILLFLAVINLLLGDKLGSFIIVLIAFVSAIIRYFQEYSVYKFNKELKSKIISETIVIRNDKEIKINVEKLVPGDIVKLNAGSIIPADLKVLECKDLFINASVFTGESVPVEKNLEFNETDDIFYINNIILMGSSVISGSATAIVIKTGFDTYLGKMGKEINIKKEPTNFELGMKRITNLLIKYMVLVCAFVLVVDGLVKHNFNEAILFALSVAVGITPSMLPMIVNVNLTKGSKNLSKKKTLVKRIESIQNLGAIDILCTDKTGTLTEDKIVLQKYIDVDGNENEDVLDYAYLNSYYSTGMKNLVDRAILSYGKEKNIIDRLSNYEKIDEIPFDYDRKKMSIIVKKEDKCLMITKGALEEILSSCTKVKRGSKNVDITKELISNIEEKAKELASSGMQVIALAEKKEYPGKNVFNSSYEKELTFIGFVGFLDEPKKDVKNIINKLKKIGISTKILTGDNPYATKCVASLAGLRTDNIILGSDIDKMSDESLSCKLDDIDIFARLNPLQKERVVSLYKQNGHVVGYMGDGVNDSPSLHKSDIGISVNTATSIAKEASDIILLEKSLKVIYDGVIEGRKVYGNIIKYMKMALSADFGDVFSIMIASIFLPFLPLLPIQMLLQDFIYDISQIGIPYDNVDEDFLSNPKKWDTKGISKFMQVMGVTSSIIDVLSFLVFWFVLGYNNVNFQAYFQTAWFVTCLITELMIIYNVRTSKKPFSESNPSKELLLLTLVSIVLTIVTPILLTSIDSFNFVVLPPIYYLYLIILVILYFVIVSIIKKVYIKKYKEWL